MQTKQFRIKYNKEFTTKNFKFLWLRYLTPPFRWGGGGADTTLAGTGGWVLFLPVLVHYGTGIHLRIDQHKPPKTLPSLIKRSTVWATYIKFSYNSYSKEKKMIHDYH